MVQARLEDCACTKRIARRIPRRAVGEPQVAGKWRRKHLKGLNPRREIACGQNPRSEQGDAFGSARRPARHEAKTQLRRRKVADSGAQASEKKRASSNRAHADDGPARSRPETRCRPFNETMRRNSQGGGYPDRI